MKTAYHGDGQKRWTLPVKTILAAFALALCSPLAMAQPQTPAPAPAPGAPPSGGFSVEEPAAAPQTPAATTEPAAADAAAGEEKPAVKDYSVWGMLTDGWEKVTIGDPTGWVTLITFGIMAIMFAGSIYIAASKAIDQTGLMKQAQRVPGFWDANTLDEGIDVLGNRSVFRNIAEGAIAQANSSQAGLGARITRSDRMSHQVGIEVERINARLQGGMAFLATVGAICPFVGLFGTVVGIVGALTNISKTGNAAITVVAGPVGEALNMTAIGLAVAVPAVIFYNLLGRRNKTISDAARHFAYDVDKLMASSAKA